MNLSVIIPAYNEEDNIENAILDVAAKFPDAEIIVINDASTDRTASILDYMQNGNLSVKDLRVLTNTENCGHGYSVMKGLVSAQGDYILYIDADRQIDIDNIYKVGGVYDFVSGWRTGRQDKLFRKVVSFGLKMTNLVFHRMYIKDANCPFKLYKRSSLLQLLDEVPNTHIVPIACLEVLARKHKLKTLTIETPHKPYQGIRQGFLQLPDKKFFQFCFKAFKEITSL